MSRGRSLTVRAYAKVNLCLEVLGRRPDGFHELATVFAAVSLHDTLTLALTPKGSRAWGLELAVDGWSVPQGPSNLVMRAAARLLDRAGRPPAQGQGLRVSLTKRIPPGGGLGGGSSDAAATLVGLAELLSLPLARGELEALAGELGSDVPFFVASVPAALGKGRGEQLTALPRPALEALVLAWPGEPVGTAWAYSLLTEEDFSGGTSAFELAEALRRLGRLEGHPALGRNAFLRPVMVERPDIAGLLERLRELGASVVSLAGSGACVWGLFAEYAEALRVADALVASGIWACAVQPVGAGVEILD